MSPRSPARHLAPLALVAACAGGPAPAPEASPASGTFGRDALAATVISRIDDDGDGRIGPAEHGRRAGRKVPFAELDLDASGFLEATEVGEALDYHIPECHLVEQATVDRERPLPGR